MKKSHVIIPQASQIPDCSRSKVRSSRLCACVSGHSARSISFCGSTRSRKRNAARKLLIFGAGDGREEASMRNRCIDRDVFDEANANLETIADLASTNDDLHRVKGGDLAQLLRLVAKQMRDSLIEKP